MMIGLLAVLVVKVFFFPGWGVVRCGVVWCGVMWV